MYIRLKIKIYGFIYSEELLKKIIFRCEMQCTTWLELRQLQAEMGYGYTSELREKGEKQLCIAIGIIGADKGRPQVQSSWPSKHVENNSYEELKQDLVRSRGASGVSFASLQ